MEWLQFVAGIGVGTLGAKVLDILWLQRRQEQAAHRAWLRAERIEAFSEVVKEFWSFGLHQGGIRDAYQIYGAVSKSLLLIEDDALVERIDKFVSDMDRMNSLTHVDTPEASDEGEKLYQSLRSEAREIASVLRSVVLHG